ncbi:hypothetical protein Tco_0123706, partial [Tanacetum coccineum]
MRMLVMTCQPEAQNETKANLQELGEEQALLAARMVNVCSLLVILIIDSCGTDEVKLDADMERGDNAGMDIDNVSGSKDEIPETDVISGAGKDDQFDVFANFEAEQGLAEPSGKDKEPIVYGITLEENNVFGATCSSDDIVTEIVEIGHTRKTIHLEVKIGDTNCFFLKRRYDVPGSSGILDSPLLLIQ